MQRNWITAALQRQLKICRAIAGTEGELAQIAKIEEAILTVAAPMQAEPYAVNFATSRTESTEEAAK